MRLTSCMVGKVFLRKYHRVTLVDVTRHHGHLTSIFFPF